MENFSDPDEGTNTSFRCRRRCEGAFLSLPFDGVKKDVILTRRFEAYIRQHCDSWLEFAITNDHDVRLEDLILVTGCDLTSSWAMAAFVNPSNPEVSLGVQVSQAGTASFQWAVTNQPHHNEPNQVRQTSLSFPPHRQRSVECLEITLCFPQRISRETNYPFFQDVVEGRCGTSFRQSR